MNYQVLVSPWNESFNLSRCNDAKRHNIAWAIAIKLKGFIT